MASLALSVAGGAFAGPGGAFAGGIAGSVIDGLVILPLLNKRGPQGNRVEDLRLQSANEGAPIHFIIGPRNKVAGTVIWHTDLIERQERISGKGGGKSSQKIFKYSIHCQISVCEGPISGIRRIYANEKLIWGAPTLGIVAVTDDDLSVTRVGDLMVIHSPIDTGPDLTEFFSGTEAEVVVSGFTNPDNNGTFDLLSVGLEDDETFLTLRNDDAVAESAGATVTLQQDLPDDLFLSVADEIRIYTGTDTQLPDSLIQSIEGADNVPAYRGLVNVVFENLQLEQFGNTLPRFIFEVEADEEITLKGTFCRILDRADIDHSAYHVGELEETDMLGYDIAGPQPVTRVLEPLMLGYNVERQEIFGVLKFFLRGTETAIDIKTGELGARTPGDESAQRLFLVDKSSWTLPSEVVCQYIDPSANYETGVARERRNVFVIDHTISVDMPLTMTRHQAREVASRLLWTAWTERQSIEIPLPPSKLYIGEGSVINIPLDEELFVARVTELNRGNNWLLSVKAVIEDVQAIPAIFQDSTTSEPDVDPPYVPPVIALVAFDGPALRQVDLNTIGYYYAVAAQDPTAVWLGASVLSSTDDVDFSVLAVMGTEATIGMAMTALADPPIVNGTEGFTGLWDRDNTVDVYVFNGSLSAAESELEVLNGANRMRLGSEIIGFVGAELIGTRTYRLSTILRGIRDTDPLDHAVGELFLVPSTDTTMFQSYDAPGDSVFLKGVAYGASVDAVASEELELNAGTLRPFKVCHVETARDESDNITLSWTRRTRAFVKLLTGSPIPIEEEEERYFVDVIDPLDSDTVLRVIDVSTTEASYSADEQIEDGITPGDSITFRISQVSATVGRGGSVEVAV